MSTDNNVEILRNAYAMWTSKDPNSVDHWVNLVADNVEWHSLADGEQGMEFTRCCNCKDDVLRYFNELITEWDMLEFRVDEFIADGDRVVVMSECEYRHKTTGKLVRTPKADIFRMQDGKVVQFMEFYDTAKALAASQP